MALKTLMLRKKIDSKKKELDALRSKDAEFEKREKDLETSIQEAETDEEKETVEEAVEQFENEKQEHEDKKASLVEEVEKLEADLAAEEAKQELTQEPKPEERKAENKMEKRTRFFGMNIMERDAFLSRNDVKEFLQRTRELAKEKRSVTGADLLIPTVVLDLIRENIAKFSKLYKHVNMKSVPGKARQNIMGAIPEAVWTEMCATLNELDLSFFATEVDGYKVGGYIAICNAVLEDSDVDLATEIITALGQAIGLALDKAILYGTGTKMPLGIMTRLAQKAQPENYPTNARPWEDLSATNLLGISGKTDAALFKAIVEASGAAKGKYSRGTKFWAMNETTYTKLLANALSINASGAIVSGQNGTMPVIGGDIETLNFIPDNVIIGGYGDLYLLAERAGMQIDESKHVKFLEDQTVFKGTARYDGCPVIAEGFVAIGIDGTVPAADAVTFTADTANAA